MVSLPTFLTAEWRHLVMLNYSVDPAVLQSLVPRGTELDFFGGRTFLSVVGFRFLETRIFGVPFPGHRNFEEVNLRFYVRLRGEEGWRRGVVFISELVPRRAIAFIARAVYGEPYAALPMRHRIDSSDHEVRAEYSWLRSGRWERLYAQGAGTPLAIESGSEEEFIMEHYWGYTALGANTNEYQVKHPRWRFWPAVAAGLEADVRSLYGERFLESLMARASSAFIAEGSQISVKYKSRLTD